MEEDKDHQVVDKTTEEEKEKRREKKRRIFKRMKGVVNEDEGDLEDKDEEVANEEVE